MRSQGKHVITDDMRSTCCASNTRADSCLSTTGGMHRKWLWRVRWKNINCKKCVYSLRNAARSIRT